MGNIGEIEKEIWSEPLETPVPKEEPTPAPKEAPERVPEPQRIPVGPHR
jgi:hypothetical protein